MLLANTSLREEKCLQTHCSTRTPVWCRMLAERTHPWNPWNKSALSHMMRRDCDQMTKRALNVSEGEKGRGHLSTTWTSSVQKDLNTMGVGSNMMQNREDWRKMIQRIGPK
ncbi:hypothetical protein EVAR_19231_1 [Eumeta japonica]|uniref:Uncharacterized protein n=1 Tax=Eumeta variegata TaxID=151549 RepID=A0A4C1VFL7_EUMVA|nr:hypothetical protein EVAR_19231_1 [Eumeta japonica]